MRATKKSAEDVDIIIKDGDLCIVTPMNHITEIEYLQKMNFKVPIKKLNSREYVNLATGEIDLFSLSDNRSENKKSLYNTFKKLRYLINNNFSGKPNEFFLTLTFAKNELLWRPKVEDSEYISNAFKSFIRRLKRVYGDVQFVRVLEPHADGHAHLHVLLRFDDYEKLKLSNKEMASYWQLGFTKINSLSDVDNIGAYVSAYLGDLDLTEPEATALKDLGLTDKVVSKKGKSYLKGGRLKYYPVGAQIFNKSRKLKYPIRQKMSYKNAKKIAGSAKPTFQKSIHIATEKFSNELKIEYYNSKRV